MSDLRDVKEQVVGGLADLERSAGRIPDIKKHEDLVVPILEKVDRDMDAERHKPAPKPKEKGPGDWYGEPGHSPQVAAEGTFVDAMGVTRAKSRVAPAGKGEKLQVTNQVIGEYAIGKKHATPLNGAPSGVKTAAETVVAEKYRMLARRLVADLPGTKTPEFPEFKRRLEAVVMSNLEGDARFKALVVICDEAERILGDFVPAAVAKTRRAFSGGSFRRKGLAKAMRRAKK